MSAHQIEMHAYPATPVNPGYSLPSVRIGFNWMPVLLWRERPCYVANSFRVGRSSQGRTAYNAVVIRYLDDNTCERVTAGKFSRAKYASATVIDRVLAEGVS